MSNSTTATVETLTAEVRVLMVGSRQVTLSVFGQLDEVGPEDIEPFGRVSPRDAREGWVYVVGRDVNEGELVRSSLPYSYRALNAARSYPLLRDRLPHVGVSLGAPKGLATTASAFAEYGVQAERAARLEHPGALPHLLLLNEAAAAFRRAVQKPSSPEEQQMLLERAQDSQHQLDLILSEAAAWEFLPLIVLAGLR